MEAQAWPATEKQDEHEYSPSREADSSEEDGDWGQNGRESQNEYANPKQTPAPQVTIYFWICYHGTDAKKIWCNAWCCQSVSMKVFFWH